MLNKYENIYDLFLQLQTEINELYSNKAICIKDLNNLFNK